MVFDLQSLKSCGFKVFNFVDDNEAPARRAAASQRRNPFAAARLRRKLAFLKAGGSAEGFAART